MRQIHRRKRLSEKFDPAPISLKPEQKHSKSEDKHVLAILLILRSVNMMLVRTWFVPDEYWQSLEVAHNMVYNYGYLTWEWKVGIRSYLHPLLFSSVYQLTKWAGCETCVLYAPRIFQMVVSAVAEWYFYKFVKSWFSAMVAKWTIASLTLSWFWWYCCTRTLINTLEAVLFCIAVYFYPLAYINQKTNFDQNLKIFTCIAGLAAVVRPTSITLWIPLYVLLLHRLKTESYYAVFRSLKTIIAVCFVLLTLSFGADYLCYGRWTSPHYNFLKFNIINNQGTFYGSHAWHWYLSQGLPVVVGTILPFSAHGLWILYCDKKSRCLVSGQLQCTNVALSMFDVFLVIMIFTVFIYSIPGHKEFRFILALVPIFCLFSGTSLSYISKKKRIFFLIFLAVTNIPLSLYFGLVHQSGPHQVMKFLQKNVEILPQSHVTTSEMSLAQPSVLFLTPCHSTPYHSFIHRNISMRFLTCDPDFHDREGYIDEADEFYLDPVQWFKNNFNFSEYNNFEDSCLNLPNRIVLFDVFYEKHGHIFSSCYIKCQSYFHTHFPEGRVGSNMFVLCRTKPEED
ncbi:GPI alpha-1,2-mannosyltransferase 3-like [Clavelina lepadiformis]|uniref:GPI alpha-1,2-mannosyltransferase 3-like n=1 Tax=Clavelina lepadiformis TaxID=159417 RepID=UPI004041DBDA